MDGETKANPPPLNLLSLDGGGVRGLSSLIILRHLMKRINPQNPPKPCQYFDLIGGTSTGGLIAIMLGRLEMDIDGCIEMYLMLAKRAFQRKRWSTNYFGRLKDMITVQGAYSTEELEGVVKEMIQNVTADENTKMLATNGACKTFVCAFTKALNSPVLIRTYSSNESVDLLSTQNSFIWQAARATSAATLFFDPIQIGRQRFVDGATGMNNPVELVFEEAKAIWPDAVSRIQCLLSIGTGKADLKGFGDDVKGVIDTLKAIATDTEMTHERFFKNHQSFGLTGRYFRFEVQHGLGAVALDEHEKFDIIEDASERYLTGPETKAKINEFVAVRAPDVLPMLDEESKNTCLRWLRSLDQSTLHEELRTKRSKGTCQWFLDNEFKEWIIKDRSFLWLYGKQAGCGKSVLCASIIDKIGDQLGRDQALAYFYFSFRRTERQDLRALLHSLVSQLARRLTRPSDIQNRLWRVPRAFQNLYRRYMFDSAPKLEALTSAFMELLQEPSTTYVVIDALDECLQLRDRSEILEFLTEVSSSSKRETHILFTSRRIYDIEIQMKVEKIPSLSVAQIQNPRLGEDIERMVIEWVKKESPRNGWSSEIENLIISQLVLKSNEVFRWVECQLAVIQHKKRKCDVEAALHDLPEDLDETYARMLARIRQKGYIKQAWSIFQFLAVSCRALHVEEIAEAAVYELQDFKLKDAQPTPSFFNCNNRFPNPGEDLRDIFSELIIVSSNGEVSFTHFSVLEYLLCDRVDQSFHICEGVSHRFILECCILYILQFACEAADSTTDDDKTKCPLIRYACQFWPEHTRVVFLCKTQSTRTKELIASLFLDNGSSFLASMRVSSSIPGARQPFHLNGKYVSPAWFMSYYDLYQILDLVPPAATGAIDRGIDHEFQGVTALHIAIRRNFYECAARLLKEGACVSSIEQQYGGSPLHDAAQSGQANMVRLLLEYGADVGFKDFDGQNALHRAVRTGNCSLVPLLLKQNTQDLLEEQDTYGFTALHWSVRSALWHPNKDKSGIVLLLEAGADPNIESWAGTRPVDEASRYADKSLVELLVSGGATHPDNSEPFLSQSFFDTEAHFMFSEEHRRALHFGRSIWPYLSDRFWTLNKVINPLGYLQVNHAIFSYCRGNATFLGEGIYLALNSYLEHLLLDVWGAFTRLDDDTYIKFYYYAWTRFQTLARFAKGSFRYLERYFLQRMTDTRSKGMVNVIINGRRMNLDLILPIYALFMCHWRYGILEKDHRLIPAVLALHKRCQEGMEVDKGMLDAIRGSFSEVSRWNGGGRATFVGEGEKVLVEEYWYEKDPKWHQVLHLP